MRRARRRRRQLIAPRCSFHVHMMSRSIEAVGFTVIIDDIVLPDGRTCMEQLGGGGPQTLFGYQLATNQTTQVGLAAGVGQDMPASCKDWLQNIGCDLSGLQVSELPTPRAWQVFEDDGRRTQVWRSQECPELYVQLRPSFSTLPPAYQAAHHYHIGIHASHPPMTLLRQLREAAHARGGLLSVETYTSCEARPDQQALSALLAACDVFSPNEAEAASIVGPGSPQQLVGALLAAGATTVALRMGPHGALVAHGPSGEAVQVPAVPGLSVVDVTGCGNAFCGAFLAAWGGGSSLLEAAAWGCVAGGMMAEWRGVPVPPPAALHELAAQRLPLVLQGARQDAVQCADMTVVQSSSSSSSSSSRLTSQHGETSSSRRGPGKGTRSSPVPASCCSRCAVQLLHGSEHRCRHGLGRSRLDLQVHQVVPRRTSPHSRRGCSSGLSSQHGSGAAGSTQTVCRLRYTQHAAVVYSNSRCQASLRSGVV